MLVENVRQDMDIRKLLKEHPSIIGIIVALIILGFIAITILMSKPP